MSIQSHTLQSPSAASSLPTLSVPSPEGNSLAVPSHDPCLYICTYSNASPLLCLPPSHLSFPLSIPSLLSLLHTPSPLPFIPQQIILIWPQSSPSILHQFSLILKVALHGSSVWTYLRWFPLRPLHGMLTSLIQRMLPLGQLFMDLCYRSLWNLMGQTSQTIITW